MPLVILTIYSCLPLLLLLVPMKLLVIQPNGVHVCHPYRDNRRHLGSCDHKLGVRDSDVSA